VLKGLSPSYRACLHLLDQVRAAMPDAVIVGDSAQPVYAGCIYFAAPRPRSWFCSATGYGTLGYALPAAIGAQLAAPDRPVVCVAGDGGFQFTLQELGSAKEIEAPVIAGFAAWDFARHGPDWMSRNLASYSAFMRGRSAGGP